MKGHRELCLPKPQNFGWVCSLFVVKAKSEVETQFKNLNSQNSEEPFAGRTRPSHSAFLDTPPRNELERDSALLRSCFPLLPMPRPNPVSFSHLTHIPLAYFYLFPITTQNSTKTKPHTRSHHVPRSQLPFEPPHRVGAPSPRPSRERNTPCSCFASHRPRAAPSNHQGQDFLGARLATRRPVPPGQRRAFSKQQPLLGLALCGSHLGALPQEGCRGQAAPRTSHQGGAALVHPLAAHGLERKEFSRPEG